MNTPMGGGTPQAGSSQKTIAIVIAVVVVIALIGIAVTMMVLTKGGSPSATVRDYLDSVESGDKGRSYDTTIWRLNESLYSDWTDMMDVGEADYHFEINSLTEIHQKDMTVQEKHVMNDTAQTIETLLGVVVQDYCIIKLNLTVTWTDQGAPQTENSTWQFPLVKVDGSWLIVLMLDDLEDVLGYHPPSTPEASLSRSAVTNGVKITIVSITRTDVPWDDVGVDLSVPGNSVGWYPTDDLATGSAVTANYSDLPLGPINVCCLFTDLTGNGYINGGDFFTLFTYGGVPTFSAAVTYSLDLVYEPNGSHMSSMTFTG